MTDAAPSPGSGASSGDGPVPNGPDQPVSLARATVLVDGGSVTLLPRRAPVGQSGPLRGRALAVLPLARADSGAGLARIEAALDRVLPTGPGVERLPATLGPDDAPALGLLDLPEGAVVALGRALELAAVFYWDGRRARLVTTS